MGKTIVEKILARSSGRESVSPGDYIEVTPRTVTVLAPHTAKSKGLPEMKEWGRKVFDPSRIMIVDGHLGATASHGAQEGRELIREWMEEMGIPSENFVRIGRGGIENMVASQRCWALPGECFFQGVNGHISTAGALGAFAALSYETAAYLVRGKTWVKVPSTIRVNAVGSPRPGVLPRDVSESLLRLIGPTGAIGSILEWGGEYIDQLQMDGRFSICSQALFSGAWTAIINPDGTTIEYAVWSRTDVPFEPLSSDPDAHYEQTITLDVSTIEPIVVVPPTRSDLRNVEDVAGIEVTKGFIGSDSGGWLNDMRVAAQILKGRSVPTDIVLNITPGTVEILKVALREGLIEIFVDAGCVVPTPNEGMECGYNTPLEAGDVCIAAGQTNYPGRMGSDRAEIYLANAAVVAASCVEGRITHPAPYLA